MRKSDGMPEEVVSYISRHRCIHRLKSSITTPGQHFVRTSFLTLGALSLLLAGGIVLTYRNVSKEMALARLKSDFRTSP
jgi:hypothetical protein